MDFSHKIIGEQYINNKYFDEIIMKASMQYPALFINTSKPFTKSSMNVLKNCFNMSDGDGYIYILIKDKMHGLGKINIDIENLYKLETLFASMGVTLLLKENEDAEIKQITSKEYVHTIKLHIRNED